MKSTTNSTQVDDGYAETADDGFVRRFVNLWILSALALSLPYFFAHFSESPIDRPIGMFAMLVVGMLVRSAIHWHKMLAARYLMVVPYVVTIFVVPFLVNGIRSPIIMAWPTIILLAGWLLGRRAATGVAAVAVAGITLAWAAEAYWHYQWPVPPRPAELWMTTLNAVAFLTAATVWHLLGSYSEVQRQEKEMRRQLDEANTALADKLEFRSQQLDQSDSALNRVRADYERAYPMAMMAGVIPSVTHDINTPVSNIGMAASTLSDALADFRKRVDGGTLRRSDLASFLATLEDGLDIIQSANQRAGALVASLKQMSIDQVTQQRRVFALDQLVREVMTALAPSLKARQAVVVQDIAPGLAMDSFPGPLEQVITNLVQNALVHGFDGRASGTIAVRARLVSAEQVRIELEDDGVGMSDDIRSHIFEPFFTTRAGQGGSGIGLSLSKRLVEETLGGHIFVESTPNGGSRFFLELPLAPVSRMAG